MSSVLTGNLAFLEVINIVKLLVSDHRTGKLILQREDESGELYVEDGRVVHAATSTFTGEHAFRDILIWNTGKFAFEPDTRAPQRSVDKDTAQLISEGSQLSESWRRVSTLIPTFKVRFRKTDREPAHDVKLKAKDWEILDVFADQEMSVSDVATKAGQREIDVATTMYDLIEAGLLEVGSAAKAVKKEAVNDRFFKQVENELIQLIGPVASIIIDDVVEAMGESRSGFPKDKVASFVESVTGEIYDPAKQLTFQQFMLKQIKSL